MSISRSTIPMIPHTNAAMTNELQLTWLNQVVCQTWSFSHLLIRQIWSDIERRIDILRNQAQPWTRSHYHCSVIRVNFPPQFWYNVVCNETSIFDQLFPKHSFKPLKMERYAEMLWLELESSSNWTCLKLAICVTSASFRTFTIQWTPSAMGRVSLTLR